MNTESADGPSAAAAVRKQRGTLAWPEDVERLFHRAVRDCFSIWPWLQLRDGRRRQRWFWRPEERLPDVDVFERERQIVIRADLQGRKPEDIDVWAESDMLVVQSRRDLEPDVRAGDCCERAAPEFTRDIRLPEGIRANAEGGVG